MNTLSSLLKFIGEEIAAQRERTVVGEIKGYAGSTAPSKWLICDGSAVSRTTYADLFAVIGTTYGTGDGSTTFNLPDMKGRTPIGVSSGHALGTKGGAETHTLTIAEMPSHTHNQGTKYSSKAGAYAPNLLWADATGTYVEYETVMARGGGQAHNNMQPFTTVNFIIYAGV